MLRFHGDIENLTIVDLSNGRKVASTQGFIIDPHEFKIAAFICKSPRVGELLYLQTGQIKQLNGPLIAVDSFESLTVLDELVRLKEFISINYQIVGKKAITQKKKRIGVVNEYAIDDSSFNIEKLYIRPPITKIVSTSDRVVDRSQIVEISDNYIMLKDPTIKVGAPLTAEG